jgi:hypothetical protein
MTSIESGLLKNVLDEPDRYLLISLKNSSGVIALKRGAIDWVATKATTESR